MNTFTAHGEVWTRHTRGFCPVGGIEKVHVLMRGNLHGDYLEGAPLEAWEWDWGSIPSDPSTEIIAYRLAAPKVEGPSDGEMLDWLDKHAFTAYRQRDPEDNHLLNHCVVVNDDRPESHRHGNVMSGIRAAISAAMKAEGKGEQS